MNDRPGGMPWLVKVLLPLLILLAVQVAPIPARLQAASQAALLPDNAGAAAEAEALQTILSYQPWRSDVLERMGELQMENGDFEQAAQTYALARQTGTISVNGLLALGQAYENTGRQPEALRVYQSLLNHRPVGGEVFERLYRIQRVDGQFREAADTLAAWRVATGAVTGYELARCQLLAVDSPNDALECLENIEGQTGSARTRAGALAIEIQAAVRSEHAGYRWVTVGRALAAEGQWDLAERAFEQGTEAEPEYAEAWAFLGEARQQNGKDGRIQIERALALVPKNSLVQALAGLYWSRAGKPEISAVHLHVAARLEPDEPAWQIELGRVLGLAGNIQAGLNHIQKAVEMDPENSAYWRALAGFTLDYQVQVREIGLPAARQAVFLQPDEAETLDLMGYTLYNLGDTVGAERFLQQATAIDTGFGKAHLHLGLLYYETGRLELAKEHLQVAAEQTSDETTRETANQLLARFFGSR